MKGNFDFFDTPNPTERGFVITAKEDNNSDVIPDFLNQKILWIGCPAWIKNAFEVRGEFQQYRLVHSSKAGYQTRNFYFAKVKTRQERETPFKVRRVKRMWPWPTVLLNLWFEEGNLPLSAVTSAGSISTAKRVHERVRYRPGDQYPTWFLIRHFLSDEPFPANGNQIQPITDSIHWSFDGSSGSFPECLHPGCNFPFYQTSGQVIDGAGTPKKEIGGNLLGQSYPATPMTDWERYPIEDTRREVIPGGIMEERILVEAIPPIDDREVVA